MSSTLVIGGSGGIGSAVVRRFAEQGDTVCLTYLRAEQSAHELAAKTMSDSGVDVRVEQLDLRDATRVAEVVGACGPDLRNLIYCAASGVARDLRSARQRHFDWAFSVNVKAFLSLYQAAYPTLAANGGSIVAYSSIGAERAVPLYALVGTTKAALESIVRYAAIEGAPDGIRANVISFGTVDTKALRALAGPAFDEVWAATAPPLGRHVRPADVATATAWLCSDGAAMVTGQVLCIDGGASVAAGAVSLAGASA